MRNPHTPANPLLTQIRHVMGRRGITQAELAGALGIGQASMSRRLTGSQAFRTDELEIVASYLNTRLVINLSDEDVA